jgi:hypothetical protein
MSAKFHSLLIGSVQQEGKHRQTLTWVPSHSKAVAWPKTSVDRLEEAGVSGLPDGPQEPWSTDEDGFLRAAVIPLLSECKGGSVTLGLSVCMLPKPAELLTCPLHASGPQLTGCSTQVPSLLKTSANSALSFT